VTAEGLRAREVGARASVLAAVVAFAATRMIAVVGSFSRVAIGMSMGIEGDACVTVVAETLMYWDRGVQPAALWCLVDRRVPVRPLGERALAGVELMSPRQRAFRLLCRRMLE